MTQHARKSVLDAPTRISVRPLGATLTLLVLCLLALPAMAQEKGAAKPAPAKSAAAKPEAASKAGGRVVNINTASAAQLTLLPRVGPALAQRILDYRDTNGRFEAPEDLILVRGIGEKTFDLLEPHVTIEGETTLTEKLHVSASSSGASSGSGSR